MKKPLRPKSLEETQVFVLRVAQHQGWKVNADQELTDHVTEGLRRNHGDLGYFHCPCREAPAPGERNPQYQCPCPAAFLDVPQWGQCFCGLFLAPSKDPTEVHSIPEREI